MAGVKEIVVVRREPLLDKVCPVCGRAFQGLSRRRYCSSTCLYRANYLRTAEHRRAHRREQYRKQKQQDRSE